MTKSLGKEGVRECTKLCVEQYKKGGMLPGNGETFHGESKASTEISPFPRSDKIKNRALFTAEKDEKEGGEGRLGIYRR